MKKIIYIVFSILVPMLGSAQVYEVVGNTVVTNFNNKVNIQPDYATGIKCTLDRDGVLTGLGMIGNNTGAQVKLALYDDLNGSPNQLIVATSTNDVVEGEMNLKVKNTTLLAGNYWIMGVYNQEGSHVKSDSSNEDKEVFYTSLGFNSNFPTIAVDFEKYSGHDFAYFLSLKKGTVNASTAVTIYPNPAFEVLNVTNATGKEMTVAIFDFLGNKKLTTKSTNPVVEINLSELNNGNYFALINNEISKQFVKK